MTFDKQRSTYTADVEGKIRSLLTNGDTDGALRLIREKLVESFKNGIAVGRRRGAKESGETARAATSN